MPSAAEPAASTDWILWDVVEEHLAEGAFSYHAWRRSLESPFDTLYSVDNRFEARFKAHVDGLLVGGPAVAEQLLKPELLEPKEPEVGRSAVAALALIQAGELALVRDQLGSSIPEVQAGAEHALSMIAPSSLGVWVSQALPSQPEPSARAAMLRVAAVRRAPLSNILASLQSSDEAEASAAAAAARQTDAAQHAGALLNLLSSPSRRVREAALETALGWGVPYAYQRCLELAADESEPHPSAMLLVALLGGPGDQSILVRQLERPSHQRFAVRALGFSGNVAHVPHLLSLAGAKDEALAKLSGEAVHNVTGLLAPPSPAADEAEAAPENPADEKLDEDLLPGRELELPTPDAGALDALFREVALRFAQNQRYLQGKPWTLSTALELLNKGKMRQRHAVALWLRVSSLGAGDLDTRALTQQQHGRLHALQTLPEGALVPAPGR